ncbi:MAG: 2-hydroxy-3-oxopropionate reductase [Gallicola sp.]|nr:2-hydroxy-3-oxopropionate reductase [Gallicola sp.]
MKVGFVGLGIMGKPMAKNIMKAGYELVVYTLEKEIIDEMVSEGAVGVNNSKEVAEQSDVIFTMLPNSPQVEQVLFNPGGLVEGLSRGKTIIDMSSINPVASKSFAKKLEALGVDFLDAPVSGGEPKAVDGTVSIMVGGKTEVFDKYYDLMMTMAGSVVRVGEVGAGNTTKLANQIVVALNIAAVSEAMILAKKADVDPSLVYEAIRGGLAGSTVMDAKVPMMIEGNYDPGFRIELHIKDLQNALDTSHEIQVALPLTASVMEIMQSLKIDGFGGNDHSAIVKYYEKINNIDISKGEK